MGAVALLPSLISIFTLFVARRVNFRVNDLAISINGHMAQLLTLTASASKAEGVLQEKDRDKTLADIVAAAK